MAAHISSLSPVGQEQVLTHVWFPRLFRSPGCQQVQAWAGAVCTQGGIDGNKQLRLVGQVLQVAYGKVLGIFPVPLPPHG